MARYPASSTGSNNDPPALTMSNIEAHSVRQASVPPVVPGIPYTAPEHPVAPTPVGPFAPTPVAPNVPGEASSSQPPVVVTPSPSLDVGPDARMTTVADTWPTRVAMANHLWDTSVPQATARLNDDETVRPSINLPGLDSFRQLSQLRAQSFQHRASGAPTVSPAFARLASGGMLSSPLESGLTTGQLEALPTDFQGLATGMASHQAANADRLSQLREDRRLRAVQRLAAERAAREPADWLMEDASRVGSATVASSSNQGPTCAICQETVGDGEELVILRCAHMYHAQCMVHVSAAKDD